MHLERETTSKKHYESPTLVIYGKIREITQNVGTTSSVRDAPGGAPNKTR